MTDRGDGQELMAPVRGTLIAGSAGLLVLYYVFCIVSLPIAFFAKLAQLVVASLFLGKDLELDVRVEPRDAPGLWQTVERIARALDVETPEKIVVTMEASAGVMLSGYSKGRGGCTLMIGYDFLAALSADELEAIIAHELAHAKLVQRGFRIWIAKGLARMSNLANVLEGFIVLYTAQGGGTYVAKGLCRITHFFGRNTSRLFGAYERHSELEADRVAAEVCGPEVVRRALRRTLIVCDMGASVDYHRRMVQLQRPESYSEWLRGELTPDDAERAEIEERAEKWSTSNDFSTHPPLSVRLAALPESTGEYPGNGESAMKLLSDPDGLAQLIMARIEDVSAKLQSDDSERLSKQAKARGGVKKLTPWQILVGLWMTFWSLAGVAPLVGSTDLARDIWLSVLLFGIGLTTGMLVLRKLGFRERIALPVPDSGAWRKAMNSGERRARVEEWQDDVRAELLVAVPDGLKNRRARARYWADRCYEALGSCDYRRAYVAAKLCLESDKKNHEGLLGLGISAAFYRLQAESTEALNKAFTQRNLQGSLPWGMAWGTILLEQWDYAEGYMHIAIRQRPKMIELRPYLVRCQWERGKILEAAKSARQAVSMDPENTFCRILLAGALLAAGRPMDAEREMDWLEEMVPDDPDVMFYRVGVDQLLGRHEEAMQGAAKLLSAHSGGKWHVRLGQIYASAKLTDLAVEHYEQGCREEFWPEALVGLSLISFDRKDHEKAREYLAAAIDLTRDPAPGAKEQFEVLDSVFQGLAAMSDPTEGCTAYEAKFPMQGLLPCFTHMNLLVVAEDESKARETVGWVRSALRPGEALPDVEMKPLPKNQQPAVAVPPGVHGFQLSVV